LVSIRNNIRAEYAAAADGWKARRARFYGDENRQRYTPEGLQALDQEFETKVAQERDALADRLARRLDAVEDAVRTRLDEIYVLPVGRDDDAAALQFAHTLAATTPRHAGQMLADFVAAATENPALAYSALPLMRSLHDRGDGWKGDWDLARAIELAQRIVDARPNVARAEADLRLLDETRRQLGHLDDAAWISRPSHHVLDATGHEVPARGTAGLALEWSGSPDAQRMFGAGPSLSGTEPVVARVEADHDVGAWVRSRGILRGRAPDPVEDEE
jgi:hypothetical protein